MVDIELFFWQITEVRELKNRTILAGNKTRLPR